MERSKSPTPFDEDSNSTLHAQPQPWQPAATKKDEDAYSTKGPVKGGTVLKKTTKFDDIQRPTGFAHLTTELQAKKHRTGMNLPKHSNRGSVYKPAPGANKKWNTIDRFVSKDCSNGSKTPLTSSVTAPVTRSIPEKSTSCAPRRNLTDGPGANIIAIEVDDDFYNDEVMVLDPLDQALNGAGKQNAAADAAVAEDDDEVLLRALGEATPSRAPGSHKDNTVKGFTFLSDDEEQSAGAAGNPVLVANKVTNATAGKVGMLHAGHAEGETLGGSQLYQRKEGRTAVVNNQFGKKAIPDSCFRKHCSVDNPPGQSYKICQRFVNGEFRYPNRSLCS
ncbi:hypothetical protein AAVH_31374 [Aphelenchoides avenae]|nr:hypothetical protein AAVH_31374 [Aphelenchus avenae]